MRYRPPQPNWSRKTVSSVCLGAAPAQRALPVVVEDVRLGRASVVVPADRGHACDLDVVVVACRISETTAPAVGVVGRNRDRN